MKLLLYIIRIGIWEFRIVASRLVAKYKKPTIVLSDLSGVLKGSEGQYLDMI